MADHHTPITSGPALIHDGKTSRRGAAESNSFIAATEGSKEPPYHLESLNLSRHFASACISRLLCSAKFGIIYVMVFIDYYGVGLVGLCLVSITLAVVGWRAVADKRKLIQVPVRLFGFMAVPLATLVLFMFGCSELWDVNTTSAPIYSPDGKQAARVEDTDAGALGGYTAVVLYSNHGLETKIIERGEWKQVETNNVKWITNGQLQLVYNPTYEHSPECLSSRLVQVVCKPCDLQSQYSC